MLRPMEGRERRGRTRRAAKPMARRQRMRRQKPRPIFWVLATLEVRTASKGVPSSEHFQALVLAQPVQTRVPPDKGRLRALR